MMHLSIDTLLPGEAANCEGMLRSLPLWFGTEAAMVSCRGDIERMETYVASDLGEAVGFIAVRQHNTRSAEIQVMAVRKEFHRMGVGRALVSFAEARMRQWESRFLQVKTLGPYRPSQAYEKTRLFYEAMGFSPLEETTSIWGEESPCLMMVKRL